MAGQIQSVYQKVIITIASVAYDVSASVESAQFRIVANSNSELVVRFTTPSLPSGIVPDIGTLITLEIWGSFFPNDKFRSGNCYVTECVTDGYYFDLRAVPFDISKIVIPGDGVTPTTLTNNTLRMLADAAKTALAIPATGISADAVNVYIGTVVSGAATQVTASIDRPYLEALYDWSSKLAYYAYCWRNALYCVDFLEDYGSLSAPVYKFSDCIESRVSFGNIADSKVFRNIYRLPAATAVYSIPWVRFGKIQDMASEGHYYNSKAGQRRAYGLALQSAGAAQSVAIEISGIVNDNLRPGKRFDLGDGFFNRIKGAYIITEITHSIRTREGWKISIRGIKAYTF